MMARLFEACLHSGWCGSVSYSHPIPTSLHASFWDLSSSRRLLNSGSPSQSMGRQTVVISTPTSAMMQTQMQPAPILCLSGAWKPAVSQEMRTGRQAPQGRSLASIPSPTSRAACLSAPMCPRHPEVQRLENHGFADCLPRSRSQGNKAKDKRAGQSVSTWPLNTH